MDHETPPESELGWPTADSQYAAPEWPAADTSIETAAAAEIPLAIDDSDAPVELDGTETVRAENVNLSQGGVKTIEASNVMLSQGGAGQVRAEQMNVEQSGVGLARVEKLTLGNGASAFAVVADQATIEEGSNTFLVVTRTLSGDARPTIDWRGAMAFGAGVGLVLSIMRRVR